MNNPPKELSMLLNLVERMIADPEVPDKYFNEVIKLIEVLREKFNLD